MAQKRGMYSVGLARREQILDAAAANFAQLGYYHTTLAKIAQDVGLTAPGLMHHFPTKQHLLVAVAERRLDLASRWAQSGPADTDGTGPLRNMVRLTELFVSQPGMIELYVLISSEAGDPSSPAHEMYAARYEPVIAELTAAFHASVAAGFLRQDVDYESIARECVAVADGLQLQWVFTKGTLDIVRLTRQHLERLAPHILVVPRAVDLSVPPELENETAGTSEHPQSA